MYYTIYKITNKLNQKFYIGKHQTKDLNDGYMGSGKLLKAAYKKHGIENFSKEILHVFENEEEMNAKEKELVIISEQSYNLCEGGKGGFSYINKNSLGDRKVAGSLGAKKMIERLRSDSEFLEQKRQSIKKARLFRKTTSKPLNCTMLGKTPSAETIQKMSLAKKGPLNNNFGKPRSEETKRKISESLKKRKAVIVYHD